MLQIANKANILWLFFQSHEGLLKGYERIYS